MAYLNVVTKWKKYVFTLGHGSSNQIIIFFSWSWCSKSRNEKKKNSLDHDMVKVVEDVDVVEK